MLIFTLDAYEAVRPFADKQPGKSTRETNDLQMLNGIGGCTYIVLIY